MDPKLVYWTAALVNLAVIVFVGWRAIVAVRAGDIVRHRRGMRIAGGLVVLFLASYIGKVAFLGKEDRSAWTALDYAILYLHECCIAVMLVASSVALYRAWRFQGELGEPPKLPGSPLPGGLQHTRAGKIAAWAGLFAFVTAIGVWGGMGWRAL
ncbi:MAG: DUF420 domain-containing protein [Myxococcota bacterium]